MGAFSPLLPIVITCARQEQAVAVNTLNTTLARFSPRDAHALAFSIQGSALDIPNDKKFCPIYAIRKTLTSKETGVWIGFGWHAIEKNIGSPPTVEKFTGKFDGAKNTIIYMLHKPGFNFPLRVEGQPIPQPWTLLPRSAADVTVPLAPIPFPSSPTKSRLIPPPRASHIVSPSKDRERGSRASSSSDDSFASAQGDELSIQNAVASMAISERNDAGGEREDALAIEILAQMITPPAGMVPPGENIFRFPISFGAHVDKFLMTRGVTEGELWSLLQARVHTANIDQFAHQLSMKLAYKFNSTDAHYLWTHIKFLCV